MPEDIKTEIETKVVEVRKTAEGEDVDAMKSVTDALGQLIQKIGASVYEGQEVANGPHLRPEAPQGGEADPSSEESSEDGVIDGEVSE